MINLIKYLDKWKIERKDEFSESLCITDNITKDTFLHTIYSPVKNMPKFFSKKGWFLPDDLKKFYQKYNGARLFFASFNIYGCQINSEKTDKVPYDIFIENSNHPNNLNYIIFGSILSCYYFAYKNDANDKKYYKLNAQDYSVVKAYNSLEQFFESELPVFINEYNFDGTRIHPNINETTKKFPLFGHIFSGDINWDTDEKN